MTTDNPFPPLPPPALTGDHVLGVLRAVLPDLMHAIQVARPFHKQGWVYEEKIDGWRMLAIKDAGQVRLVSRNAPARRLSPNGFAAWAEVLHRGYEGMVAKDPEAPYVGGRTLKWLQVKQRDYRVDKRGWNSRNKS
jgi:ATP-dependent DNA ligase